MRDSASRPHVGNAKFVSESGQQQIYSTKLSMVLPRKKELSLEEWRARLVEMKRRTAEVIAFWPDDLETAAHHQAHVDECVGRIDAIEANQWNWEFTR